MAEFFTASAPFIILVVFRRSVYHVFGAYLCDMALLKATQLLA